MENQETATVRGWGSGPTAKEKSAVQRSVTKLLDALAPEKSVKRSDEPRARVEQHRTPAGCVLQAKTAAVSVSWFADRREQTLGELHVNLWNGVVSRGGSSHRKPEKATVVKELVLKPRESLTEACVWRAEDGREFDTASLEAYCVALLEGQIKAAANAAPAK
jgi:hypothetical protein